MKRPTKAVPPLSLKLHYSVLPILPILEGDEENEGNLGRYVSPHALPIEDCDLPAGTIYVNPKSPPETQACTLIHEILHAIWDHMDMPKTGMDEEACVEGLSRGLASVIQDNPALMGTLLQGLVAGKPIVS